MATETRECNAFALFAFSTWPTVFGTNSKFTNKNHLLLQLVVKLHDENSPLLGKTLEEKTQVLQYLSFATSDFMAAVSTAIGGILGRVPFNKKAVQEAIHEVDQYTELLEKRLVNYTYLVGERLTVADLFFATCFFRPFTLWYGSQWRKEHKVLLRWFNTVTKSEYIEYFFKDLKLADTPITHPEHKKEKKKGGEKKQQQQPKKQKQKQAAPPAQPKKPKHPLEALGKSSIPIDELKRYYSNHETREESLPWFWNEFWDPKEWSLYKVAYKYNDELKMVFMSNNLIGGFFARLSASTKYLFGCMVVCGEDNHNGIVGAFLVRGQDYKPAFDVAPDWESYEFTKLDPTKPEDKEFVNDAWAWDKPLEIDGVKKEVADGKVFK